MRCTVFIIWTKIISTSQPHLTLQSQTVLLNVRPLRKNRKQLTRTQDVEALRVQTASDFLVP